MPINTNINWISMTDQAIIGHIGNFLKQQRIIQNETQKEIAERAGLNRYTISKIENGDSVTLQVFIQILRALDLLSLLDNFTKTSQVSPLEAVKLKGKQRHRVRKSPKTVTKPKSDW